MVALVVGDRAQETCTTTGTGTLSLLGAVTQFQSFAAVGVSTGNTISYSTQFTVADQSGANWETSIGVYTTSGSTLTRTTVLSSSNAGALVNFGAGTKSVFINYSATMSVSGGGGGTYPTIQPSLNLDFANTRQLDPRITFVRNSTAAYYDGQTTAMAEQNLLTYSQDFRNTADAGSTRPWLYSGITNTYGADIAPDGTTTANYLQETATTAIHILSSSAVNSVTLGSTAALTYSIYFKKGLGLTAPDWIQINTGGASNCYASFNLTTGLVGNYGGGSGISATNPINVGAGWYRCIITLATASSGIHYFYPGFTNNTNPTSRYPSYLGIITSDVQAWGAQLEQRSSATAYTKTTTAAITNYIPVLMTAPAGVARFDCDPITGKSLGLLIEESRTNLLRYSVGNGASWNIRTGALVTTANAQVAPDGTITATQLTKTAITDTAWQQAFTAVVGVTYTASAYFLKTSSVNVIEFAIRLSFTGGDYSGYLSFDTLTGNYVVRSGALANITIVDCGRYWRILITSSGTTSGTLSDSVIIIRPTTGVIVGGFNTTAIGSCIFWGAQLEAGSFATSYMPTVASTVTRAADQASITGTNFSSWYNQAQGTMYVEWDYNNAAAKNLNVVPVGMGVSGNNRWMMQQGAVPIGIQKGAVYVLNSPTFGSTQAVFLNGVTGGLYGANYADTTPMNNLLLGGAGSFALPLTGHIRKLSYYPVALSSNNLVALTS